MKVDKTYTFVKNDNETFAASVASELNWLWKDICEDYDKLWDLRKKLFYKQNAFDRMCKDKLAAFNTRCSIPYIKEKVDKYIDEGKYDFSKDKEFLQSFVSNYFPEWMWKNLTFKKFEPYNWTEAWWFSFIWNPGAKCGCRPVIRIEIPAPEGIQVDKMYDPFDKDVYLLPMIIEGNHKTDVCVSLDDFNSEVIGHGYMNNEIVAVIDEWAKKFKESKAKEKKKGDDGEGKE